MAVFDKASLVMIPSQYKEGKIYNIKPEDQSSSFEFERGSAATRVNSSGLIEQTGVSSTQLWNDNDVATSGTGSYADGVATITASTGNDYVLFRNLEGFEASDYYEVSFDTVVNSGSFVLLQGNGIAFSPNYLISKSGSYSRIIQYTHATGGQLFFWSGNVESLGVQFDGTISNFSVKKVNIDTPRLDYSGTEPALLLEPQRTNLIANANSYSGNLVYYTVTSGQNSPDGESNATLFVEKTNTASHIINSNGASISGGQTYTYSFFIKYAGKQNIPVNASDGLSGFGANIDILNGVVNSGTAEIQEFEDGWYRVSMTRTTGAGATNGTIQMNFGNITGDGQSGFYLFGYQIEQGSYATSYIPTNGQTETRLADVCQGGGDASVFNDSEGVLYAEVSRLNGDLSATTIAINKGGSEFSGFSFRTDGKIWAATYNGTSYENISQYTPTDFYDTYKICYKYKSNDFALWVNGVEVDSSVVNTLTLTGLNNLSFSSGTATNKFLGNVRALHYFPEALTDTELQQLTTI